VELEYVSKYSDWATDKWSWNMLTSTVTGLWGGWIEEEWFDFR